jgi:hypothetical membrane protein
MDTAEDRIATAPQEIVVAPPDPWIYRIVVIVLGIVVLSVVIGGVLLAIASKEVPQGILAIGSAAAGGLVGLLVPSPVGKS